MEDTVSREYAKGLSRGWRDYSRMVRRNISLAIIGSLLAAPVLYWAWYVAPVPPLWVQIVLIIGVALLVVGLMGMFIEWQPFIPNKHEDE